MALLGAITHQAMAQGGADGRKNSFIGRYRGVDAATYRGAIVTLFVATSLLGAIIYPRYRIVVRPILEFRDLRVANGVFEIKEHFGDLGLVMLPAYWMAWRRPLAAESASARRGLTWVLASIVWWDFLAGLVLNDVKGLFHQ